MKIPIIGKPGKMAAALVAALGVGIGFGFLFGHLQRSEDCRFRKYTEEIFREEVNSGTLNLHYTLANPEDYGINPTEITLGEITPGDEQKAAVLENYEQGLREFSYVKLSEENRITFDMLLLYLHTLQQGRDYELLEEILSPGLGIQAQLPVLLAEYTFYDEQDIQDYLKLLDSVEEYFQSIVRFQQEKAAAGYFMTDECLDGVLEQCREFVKDPEENYLLEVFRDRVQALPFLENAEKQAYIQENEKLVSEAVIPAYEQLTTELEKLRGSSTNEQGLFYDSGGREYYKYLLKTQVGTYEAPDSIRQRLNIQLMKDYEEMAKLLKEQPSLASAAYSNDYTMDSPEEALRQLQEASVKDFPQLEAVEYEVKYVHESMEEFLSPAFYLTPPIDILWPNTIYINSVDQGDALELFTTLGHEGFPGHLYQTLSFAESDPDPVRYLPGFGGYVEGWATYIEGYAYSYARADSSLTRLLWLNRSINLCLYSIVDMGIHYYGWSREDVTHYLGNYGIKNSSVIQEIYEAILENPVNYLKYYVGYINFLDLKEEMIALQQEEFDLKAFHGQILKIGPVQFPVLRKHMGLSIDSYLY